MSLVLENVVKKYKNFTAVNNLSFSIEKGQIFGLIGQNGAGKTTTFRMILDLQEVTSGKILWDGEDIKKANKDRFGFLPEERGIFPTMKVEEQLFFFAKIRGIRKQEAKPIIDYWIRFFELEDKRGNKAETLSKGNQQKVQLIASFLHNPTFLILDEPFSGLDPVNKDLLKKAIIELKEKGTTIIFSSHQMENVEELCDNLCLLKKGVPLFSGALMDLKKQYGKNRLSIRSTKPLSFFEKIDGVEHVEKIRDEIIIKIKDEFIAKNIYKEIANEEFIEKFSLDYPSLDEIFKDKVGAENV